MNTLKPSMKSTVITLLKHGIGQREIWRKLRVDRKTTRRIQRGLESLDVAAEGSCHAGGEAQERAQNPPGWPPIGSASNEAKCRPPKHARSACEPYREWIEEQVGLHRNAMAIYQDLVERFGFSSKYNSVKRFVRSIRKRDPEIYDRLEYEPGEEAQVDFGQGAPTLYPGSKKKRYRKPYLFVMSLKYSRRAFRKVVWRATTEVWARLHEEAFFYFGGSVKYVVLDNLKQGVLKPDIYEPELNPLYASVLAHYGAVADPARVRDPNRKGTVENAIGYTQDTGLRGRRFEAIEAQNDHLMHWEEAWASKRIHGRMKRQVEEMFQEERPHLKALPMRTFPYFRQQTRSVGDDACIEVDRRYYAARPALPGAKVTVRIYTTEIEIMDPKTMQIIRRHPIAGRPGAVRMLDSDRIFNPSRQTERILKDAACIGPKTRAFCEVLFSQEGRIGQRRMRGVIALTRKHSKEEIEGAVSIALSNNIYSYRFIRSYLERQAEKRREQALKTAAALTEGHPLMRNLKDYQAFFETHAATRSTYH